MERRTRFNLVYMLFAMFAILSLQQWWQRAQTVEVVPYSEFERYLAADKVSEVVVSDQRVTGKLKAPENGKTVVVANLVASSGSRPSVGHKARGGVHRAESHRSWKWSTYSVGAGRFVRITGMLTRYPDAGSRIVTMPDWMCSTW
jgi:ATP-dependent Zn protease